MLVEQSANASKDHNSEFDEVLLSKSPPSTSIHAGARVLVVLLQVLLICSKYVMRYDLNPQFDCPAALQLTNAHPNNGAQIKAVLHTASVPEAPIHTSGTNIEKRVAALTDLSPERIAEIADALQYFAKRMHTVVHADMGVGVGQLPVVGRPQYLYITRVAFRKVLLSLLAGETTEDDTSLRQYRDSLTWTSRRKNRTEREVSEWQKSISNSPYKVTKTRTLRLAKKHNSALRMNLPKDVAKDAVSNIDLHFAMYNARRKMNPSKSPSNMTATKTVDHQMKECTFRPKINSRLPSYILTAPSVAHSREHPIGLLKQYSKHFTEDGVLDKLADDLKECTFQPNMKKYLRKEASRRKAQRTTTHTRQEDNNKIADEQHTNPINDSTGSTGSTVDELFKLMERPLDILLKECDIIEWSTMDTTWNKQTRVDRRTAALHKGTENTVLPHFNNGVHAMNSTGGLTATGQSIAGLARFTEKSGKPTEELSRRHAKAASRKGVPQAFTDSQGRLPNRWLNGLRGGYQPTYIDCSMEKKAKQRRPTLANKKGNVRLADRGLESRCIPAVGKLLQACDSALIPKKSFTS
eukprot:Lankesteria_metandrocarpae@DN5356_c2_g1_i3.p1